MTTAHQQDILHDEYADEVTAVAGTVRRIMSAARRQDIDELESYHAFGPKFTKFDDFEPLDRQDAETTRRLEREAASGVREFTPEIVDL